MAATNYTIKGNGRVKFKVALALVEDGLATGMSVLLAFDSANATAVQARIKQNGLTFTDQGGAVTTGTHDGRNS